MASCISRWFFVLIVYCPGGFFRLVFRLDGILRVVYSEVAFQQQAYFLDGILHSGFCLCVFSSRRLFVRSAFYRVVKIRVAFSGWFYN